MSAPNEQQQLAAALQRIKALIQRKLDGAGGEDAFPYEPCAPVDRLVDGFRLGPFERDLLLWCAGVELDSTLGDLTAGLPGREGRRSPTFSLALSVLPEAHWSALTPASPLRFWRLVEPASNGVTQADLRVDERILHQLAGVPYLDTRLGAMMGPHMNEVLLTQSQSALVNTIGDAWSAQVLDRPIIQLIGSDARNSITVAAGLAEHFRFMLYRMDARQIPTNATDLEGFVRLWQRECIMGRNLLCVVREEHGAKDEGNAQLTSFCELLDLPVILCGHDRLRGPHRTMLNFGVSGPDRTEQRSLWEAALGDHATALNGTLVRLTDQFDLGWAEIRNAVAQVAGAGASVDEVSLRKACRSQARAKLDGLAKRVGTRSTWEDIILPDREKNTLRDIALHLAHRGTVYGPWGFGRKDQRGAAITALFAGPSGTGKTLAAEILANELDLELYKIDLSQVVSKYIGESEKNLARIFDAAESSGAILLFDEADALFGKRSEVKDSHDRYANIEVSYLLQRMEEYRGLAILTTNMKQALDNAFMRRLTFVVNFRFPDQEQRAAIWGRMFPAACPTEGLDPIKLAQLNISGGNIRSISLNAAHYAAAQEAPLGMAHVLRAARSEYDKLDKALSATEIKGWT